MGKSKILVSCSAPLVVYCRDQSSLHGRQMNGLPSLEKVFLVVGRLMTANEGALFCREFPPTFTNCFCFPTNSTCLPPPWLHLPLPTFSTLLPPQHFPLLKNSEKETSGQKNSVSNATAIL